MGIRRRQLLKRRFSPKAEVGGRRLQAAVQAVIPLPAANDLHGNPAENWDPVFHESESQYLPALC